MAIQYLDIDPQVTAQQYKDDALKAYIVEIAQLLHKAHRDLDGVSPIDAISHSPSENASNDHMQVVLSSFSDEAVAYCVYSRDLFWIKLSQGNYNWLFGLFLASLQEYNNRFKHTHAFNFLAEYFLRPPVQLRCYSRTEPPTHPDQERSDVGSSVLERVSELRHDR